MSTESRYFVSWAYEGNEFLYSDLVTFEEAFYLIRDRLGDDVTSVKLERKEEQ
jgi:hypothetical protein